jgi:hypothetical protein
MDVRIIVETTFENGTTKTWRLGRLSRPVRSTQPEGFGLLLEDAKSMLWKLQQAILIDQIEEISEASRVCADCNKVSTAKLAMPMEALQGVEDALRFMTVLDATFVSEANGAWADVQCA